MKKQKVSVMNVIKFAGAYIAFLIGSGFATGQEIMQYFAGYGYKGLLVGLFTFSCLLYIGGSLVSAGYKERFPNVNDVFRYYCGRWVGGVYDYFATAFIFMTFIVMLAGAGATAEQYYKIPAAWGAAAMAVITVVTVLFGLGKIVDIIGSIGPVIVIIAIGVGLGSVMAHPAGIKEGAELISSGKIEVTRIGNSWLTSGISYVGVILPLLAAFLAAVGREANSVKEAVLGTTLGAVGYITGALVLMLGILANIGELHASNIPSLILAERLWPPLASIFSLIIMAGIYTTAVPLLWSVSARFAPEKSLRFRTITIGCALAACTMALTLPYREIVNLIYGVNGYIGILLLVFMIGRSAGLGGGERRPRTEAKAKHAPASN